MNLRLTTITEGARWLARALGQTQLATGISVSSVEIGLQSIFLVFAVFLFRSKYDRESLISIHPSH